MIDTYFSFEVKLNAVYAELTHIDIPLVGRVLLGGAWDVKSHGLSMFFFLDCVLTETSLQVFL